jgi:hypothetical protein
MTLSCVCNKTGDSGNNSSRGPPERQVIYRLIAFLAPHRSVRLPKVKVCVVSVSVFGQQTRAHREVLILIMSKPLCQCAAMLGENETNSKRNESLRNLARVKVILP